MPGPSGIVRIGPFRFLAIVTHVYKYGYVKSVINTEQLVQDFDDSLFTKANYGNHAMHHLLPSPKSTCYNLRTLGHGLSLHLVKSELHKKHLLTD